MSVPSAGELKTKKCVPCEGGVPKISTDQATEYLAATPAWKLSEDGNAIYLKLTCKHFVEAMKILHQVADVAEAEQHHPDLHLTGYRKVRIDLTTHAIGGLSENDFIVAAKIDEMLA
ncbi:MAG: 4a-hydroxytetrahydrobiopterin dehydratase [Planctomycetota bacterium]